MRKKWDVLTQRFTERELRRNQHPEPKNYLPDTAQSQAVERRQQAKLPFSKFTLNIIEEVQSRLKDYHSPEQIAGCLQRFGKLTMSHKTIHQMIYRNYQGMGIYAHNLRHSHRQRQRRGNQNQKRCLIPNRVGQFFPKGTNFKIVKQAEVDRVTDLINYRPRKALDYRTP